MCAPLIRIGGSQLEARVIDVNPLSFAPPTGWSDPRWLPPASTVVDLQLLDSTSGAAGSKSTVGKRTKALSVQTGSGSWWLPQRQLCPLGIPLRPGALPLGTLHG